MAIEDSATTEERQVGGGAEEVRTEQANPTLPPRPQAPLQPLPPAHAALKHGQHQQQAFVTPQGMPGTFYDPQSQQPLPAPAAPFSKSWHLAKLVLEIVSIVFSIIIFGVAIALFARTSRYYGGSWLAETDLGTAGTVAGLALIWNTAELLTVCFSKDRRGIHPGAHVAFHLIIWLAAAVTVAWLAVSTAYLLEDDSYYYSYYSSRTVFAYQNSTSLHNCILAFIIFLLIIHFVLFVRACIETHQLNRANRRIYVRVPVPVGGPYGYYGGGAPPQQFPGLAPGTVMPPYPIMAQAPGMQPQMMPYGTAPVPPQQALLYGGFYAPSAGQPMAAPQPQQPSLEVSGYYSPTPGSSSAVPHNGRPLSVPVHPSAV
ncbi:hypothetical protein B0T17DRAFT_613650 [Bombardia bombarda]|uniref:Uncharacterized protein n=1 Tax=Bombardia bombarda TaxID=252184 RepID=A0AA39XNQ1_9PEZI|nr:hypothetical protein B0T17DRAFT_613650 [Bombardia bombarda]